MPERYTCMESDRRIWDVIYCDGQSMTVGEIIDTLNKMQSEIIRLGEQIGRTADGVLLCDAIRHFCPHCQSAVDGDSFTAFCHQCVDENGRSPLVMGWEKTLANEVKP